MAANLIAQLTEKEVKRLEKEYQKPISTFKLQPETTQLKVEMNTLVEYDQNGEITAIWF